MPAEVHLGDSKTTYRARLRDAGAEFNPSSATTKKLRFTFAGGSVVEKTATVEASDGSWFLVYVAEAGFHSVTGDVRIQGYLEFGDGSKYSTDVQHVDANGDPLRVHPNL